MSRILNVSLGSWSALAIVSFENEIHAQEIKWIKSKSYWENFRQNQNTDDYFKMIAKNGVLFCLKNVNACTTLDEIFNKNVLKSFTIIRCTTPFTINCFSPLKSSITGIWQGPTYDVLGPLLLIHRMQDVTCQIKRTFQSPNLFEK